MATIKTKWFTSAMPGAPSIVGNIGGGLIAALTACLKDGFNLLTLDSLVIASNVATGTKASHGYLVNQVVTLAGITGACASLNGDVRVVSVTTNTFTFDTSGISNQTATGTITAKTGHCGWLVPFTGTNLAVFKSGDAMSSQLTIRVDDTTAQYSTVRGAEGYTDISTEVNYYSTQYMKRSNATDANARPWIIIADSKSAYVGIQWTNAGLYDFYHFGDFSSFVAGDAYNYRLQALALSNPSFLGQYSCVNDAVINPSYLSYCPRSYAQIPGAQTLRQASMVGALLPSYSNTNIFALSGNRGYQTTPGVDAFISPSLSDNGYHFFNVFLIETSTTYRFLRGEVRGLLHVVETLPVASGYSIISGVENISGGLILMAATAGSNALVTVQAPAVCAFNLSDW